MRVKNTTTGTIIEVPEDLKNEFIRHCTTMTMKTKGEKHSVSKVKKIISISPEIIEKVEKFVENTCTVNRMVQGVQEIYGALENVTEKDARIGKFLNWLMSDIVSEEFDVLEESKEYFQIRDASGQIKSKGTKFLNILMDKNTMV